MTILNNLILYILRTIKKMTTIFDLNPKLKEINKPIEKTKPKPKSTPKKKPLIKKVKKNANKK
tara:strand:- start:891 stop:1079 length:189 start_codon:yes stop_codon:yes gene_type:complete